MPGSHYGPPHRGGTATLTMKQGMERDRANTLVERWLFKPNTWQHTSSLFPSEATNDSETTVDDYRKLSIQRDQASESREHNRFGTVHLFLRNSRMLWQRRKYRTSTKAALAFGIRDLIFLTPLSVVIRLSGYLKLLIISKWSPKRVSADTGFCQPWRSTLHSEGAKNIPNQHNSIAKRSNACWTVCVSSLSKSTSSAYWKSKFSTEKMRRNGGIGQFSRFQRRRRRRENWP